MSKPQGIGINAITVGGIKSLLEERTVEIRPLTVLAGPNSSGKSSMMQGLLLLKQTMESPFDPGALLLNGPNVRFTSSEQLLSRPGGKRLSNTFSVGFRTDNDRAVKIWFAKQAHNQGFRLEQALYTIKGREHLLRPGMKSGELQPLTETPEFAPYKAIFQSLLTPQSDDSSLGKPELNVYRERSFLDVEVALQRDRNYKLHVTNSLMGASYFRSQLQNLTHLPGLRGNPERLYPKTAVGEAFPGTFDQYVASVIAQWQLDKKSDKVAQVGRDLESLGLTWKVEARPVNDTQVELRVGRLPKARKGGAQDTVGIADVGLGVSQTLPILVALEAAKPGQMIYLEQPEIHLHPRAQVALAPILVRAALRGVRVVAETHSALLLRGIQTAVAKGEISPHLVGLHWFSRRAEDGCTLVEGATVDQTGAFGDWPVDFDEVSLNVDTEYLDAAERRMLGSNG